MKNLNQLRLLLKQLVMAGFIAIVAVYGNVASAQPIATPANIDVNRTVRPDLTSRNTQEEAFSIGGMVTGLLPGTQITLSNNGTDYLTVQQNGLFVFSAQVLKGATYAVFINVMPQGQICSVTNGSGTAFGNVVNIQVDCRAY